MSSNLTRFENLQQLLVMVKPTFEQLAMVHGAVNYRQEASFAVEILQNNDYLMGIAMKDQDSFKRAIINIAGIGLSLNPAHGLAYLIPRKGKITYDVSYKGKIALAVKSGSIKWCMPFLVYENDLFKVGKVGERPKHEYDPFSDDRGKLRGGYAVAKTNNDEFIVSYMSLKDILSIRSKYSEAYKSGNKNPWDTNEEEMIKKTLIHRSSKLWPKTDTHDQHRLDEAIELEEEAAPLPEIAVVDNIKRAEQINCVKIALDVLNIDHEYYLRETLPKIVRRSLKSFEELTDLEIDQITVQLSQMVDALPKEKK